MKITKDVGTLSLGVNSDYCFLNKAYSDSHSVAINAQIYSKSGALIWLPTTVEAFDYGFCVGSLGACVALWQCKSFQPYYKHTPS